MVLNKWDVAGDKVDLDHERARAQQKLRQRPRVLTASAKTGRHVERLLVEAVALADRRVEPDPDLAAEPLPVGGRRRAAAAGRQRARRARRAPAAEAAVHDARRRSGRRGSRSRSTPAPDHARLRVLRREPAARALPARGGPGDHRLRRAQRARSRARGRAACSSGPGGPQAPRSRPLVALVVVVVAAAVALAIGGGRRASRRPRPARRRSSRRTRSRTCTCRPTVGARRSSGRSRWRRSFRTFRCCAGGAGALRAVAPSRARSRSPPTSGRGSARRPRSRCSTPAHRPPAPLIVLDVAHSAEAHAFLGAGRRPRGGDVSRRRSCYARSGGSELAFVEPLPGARARPRASAPRSTSPTGRAPRSPPTRPTSGRPRPSPPAACSTPTPRRSAYDGC